MAEKQDDRHLSESSPEDDGTRTETTVHSIPACRDVFAEESTTISDAPTSVLPSNARPAPSPTSRPPSARVQPAGRKGTTSATDSGVSAYLLTFLLLSGLNWRPPLEPLSKSAASKDLPFEKALLLPSLGLYRQLEPKDSWKESSFGFKMGPASDQEQDFFDPMVGRFRINPAAQLESFFKSKLR